MSEGYLDFGPDKPCYDNCPLVDKTQLPDYDKVLGVLLCYVLLRHSVSSVILLFVFVLIIFYSN